MLVERVKGIEPSSQAWEARILPLNHTRLGCALARHARLLLDLARHARLCRIQRGTTAPPIQRLFYQTHFLLATDLHDLSRQTQVIDRIAQLILNPQLPLG